MTNDEYLVVSYIAARDLGIITVVTIALLMRRPLRLAVVGLAGRIGLIARRVFPIWLMLLVLFAFMSVSYLDCSHHNYQQVVAEKDYLVERTCLQTEHMMLWLAIGILAFSMALSVMLLVCRPKKKNA